MLASVQEERKSGNEENERQKKDVKRMNESAI